MHQNMLALQTQMMLGGLNGTIKDLTGYNLDPKAGGMPSIFGANNGIPPEVMAMDLSNPFAIVGKMLENYEKTHGKAQYTNFNLAAANAVASSGGAMAGALVAASGTIPGMGVLAVAMTPPAIRAAFEAGNMPFAGQQLPPMSLPPAQKGNNMGLGALSAPAPVVLDDGVTKETKPNAESTDKANPQGGTTTPQDKAKEYLKYFTDEENKKKVEAHLNDEATIEEFKKAQEQIVDLLERIKNEKEPEFQLFAINPENKKGELINDLKSVLYTLEKDHSKLAAFEMYYDNGKVGKLRMDLLNPENLGNNVDFRNYTARPHNSLESTKYISPYGTAAQLAYVNEYNTKFTNVKLYNALKFLNEKHEPRLYDYSKNTEEIIKNHVNEGGIKSIIENEEVPERKWWERNFSKEEYLELYGNLT